MPLTLQEQVDIPETKTDSLESVFARFISSMNSLIIPQDAADREFKNEMKDIPESHLG